MALKGRDSRVDQGGVNIRPYSHELTSTKAEFNKRRFAKSFFDLAILKHVSLRGVFKVTHCSEV